MKRLLRSHACLEGLMVMKISRKVGEIEYAGLTNRAIDQRKVYQTIGLR